MLAAPFSYLDTGPHLHGLCCCLHILHDVPDVAAVANGDAVHEVTIGRITFFVNLPQICPAGKQFLAVSPPDRVGQHARERDIWNHRHRLQRSLHSGVPHPAGCLSEAEELRHQLCKHHRLCGSYQFLRRSVILGPRNVSKYWDREKMTECFEGEKNLKRRATYRWSAPLEWSGSLRSTGWPDTSLTCRY